ncbi:MAG: ferrous iron transport protein A [Gammaproteobacteria bacterium]|nr:ferrous iron transport protein A [Gammaproteobacteria bacterium]
MTTLQRLSTLQAGQSAIVQALHVDTGFQYRLHALGFRIGKKLELIRIAPFNGPLQLRIGNTEVMLRKHDADQIEILV